MISKTNNLYEFGEFCLDTEERVLLRGKETIILAPKVFDTLEILVKNDQKIVSKNALMDEVWADSFVEEGNLTQNIYILRQTLGKEFIETVPRRGYRFAAEVKNVSTERTITHSESNGSATVENDKNTTQFIVAQKTKTLIKEEYTEEQEEEDQTEPISDTEVIPAATPSSASSVGSKNLRMGLALGTLGAIIIGVFGFFLWQQSLTANEPAPIENVSFSSLTDSGNIRNMSISPDGQFLAVVKRADGNDGQIWIQDINSKQELPLKLSREFIPQAINFSADGNSIYFTNRRMNSKGAEIYKTARFGGDVEKIGTNVWSNFAVSNDGEKLAFYRLLSEKNQFQLIVQNLRDKTEKVLATKDFPDSFVLRSAPAFSPDGRTIYVIKGFQKQARSILIGIDTKSGEETVIKIPKIRQLISVVALPDNEELIFSARERRKYPQVYKVNKTGGRFRRLTNDLDIYHQLSLSKDGKNLAILQKNTFSHIWLAPDLSAEKAVQITFGKNNRDGKHGVDFLADGKIIYTSLEDLNRDLWTVNPEDGSKQQLTKRRADINDRPIVSNDGNYIYFNSVDDDRTFDIERIDINSQNIETITKGNSHNDLFPALSPDGSTVYFVRRSKGKSSLFKKSLPDGEESEIKLPEGFSVNSFLTVSPDGRFIAFRQADRVKRFEINEEAATLLNIGIVSLDGSDASSLAKTIEINTIQSQFRWNETSDAIYFINHSDKDSAIWKKNVFDDTEPQKIIEFPNTRIYHFKFKDNKDLAVSRGKHTDDVILLRNFD